MEGEAFRLNMNLILILKDFKKKLLYKKRINILKAAPVVLVKTYRSAQ